MSFLLLCFLNLLPQSLLSNGACPFSGFRSRQLRIALTFYVYVLRTFQLMTFTSFLATTSLLSRLQNHFQQSRLSAVKPFEPRRSFR
jgi:hypothetical protein